MGGAVDNGRRQNVILKIYSVRGQLVATLVNEQQSPGLYEAVWNGTGIGGTPLASGIYFSQLIVGGNEVFTRKLVLIK